MKPLIFLLLILTTISNVKGDFSIDIFINYLQEKGLYEILVEIKRCFGIDISVAFCRELIKSNDCETVIRIYMPNNVRDLHPGEKSFENIDEVIDYYYQVLLDAGFKPFEIEKARNDMRKYF